MPPVNGPNPQALFSLVPLNAQANEILKLHDNLHLVSSFRPDPNNPTIVLQGLEVGFHIKSTSHYTLATIGREGDIKLNDPTISRYHCSFELHERNREEVMLQDRSLNKSTNLFGPAKMPFEPGRPHRRVVVDQNINQEFGIGGVAGELYLFRIYWHRYDKCMVGQCIANGVDNPRHARTIAGEPPITVPPLSVARTDTASSWEKIRYLKRARLGEGAFGEVWKVANVDTGEHLAVKRVKWNYIQPNEYLTLKREVKLLSSVSHANIVEFKWSQYADDEHFEIFMELKTGSVQYLAKKEQLFTKSPEHALPLLHQMLQALDYLASKEIIHRDVKPENILFTPLPGGQFLYQLADFGLANMATVARTPSGTDMYMAPEIRLSPGSPQTFKMDVWSLFVTLAYAVDAAGFQGKSHDTYRENIKAVREAANGEMLRQIREMAAENPEDRATAGDMLDKIFGGEGRTTPRN